MFNFKLIKYLNLGRKELKFKDLSTFVGKGAPLLGSLLLGNTGEKVGTMIASALGVENDKDKIMEKLINDPDAFAKVKQIEFSHREELQKLQLAEMQTITADIQDARNRELEIIKATGKAQWHQPALAWFVTAGYIALVFTLVFVPIPPDTNGAIMMLFGSLSTAWGSVMTYYYGSSHGSSKKDEVIANSMPVGNNSEIG